MTVCDVAWALAAALETHGPNARGLAQAVCRLLPPAERAGALPYLLDRLRPMMWPPRCPCELAEEAWLALPLRFRRPTLTVHTMGDAVP